MTRESAEKHEDIIKAFISGKDIEYLDKNTNRWFSAPSPTFCVTTEYRVKPEEELIPMDFSDAERLIGKVVKDKIANFISIISAVNDNGVWLNNSNYLLYTHFFDKFEFLDGSPIGKLQK